MRSLWKTVSDSDNCCQAALRFGTAAETVENGGGDAARRGRDVGLRHCVLEYLRATVRPPESPSTESGNAIAVGVNKLKAAVAERGHTPSDPPGGVTFDKSTRPKPSNFVPRTLPLVSVTLVT